MLLLFRLAAVLEPLSRGQCGPIQVLCPQRLSTMSRVLKKGLAAILTVLITLVPLSVFADDRIEKTGVAIGVSAGNMWFIPIKAIAVFWGATGGAVSYVLSGGNAELTRQIWDDT